MTVPKVTGHTPFGIPIMEYEGVVSASFPNGTIIRDWSIKEGWDAENTNRFRRQPSAYEFRWEENFKKNLPNIKESFQRGKPFNDGVHKGETCYLTADGPSLKKNGELLVGLDNVIETNRVYPGVQPKYYVSLDCGYPSGGADPSWVKDIDTSKTIGVCSVFNRPALAEQFDRVWWFDAWGKGNKISKKLEKRRPFVNSLDTALNVSYTALNLAYNLGYSKIVLVGFDYAFSDGFNHFNDDKPLFIWEGDELKMLTEELALLESKKDKLMDIDGVLTNSEMRLALVYFATQCWFLYNAGVEIVNCTEGGILDVPFIRNEPLSMHTPKKETPKRKASKKCLHM